MNGSGKDQPDHFWAQRLDGEALAPDARRALFERLRDDPGARNELLEDADLDGMLRGLGRGQQDAAPFERAVLRRLGVAEEGGRRFLEAVERRLDATPPQAPKRRRALRWGAMAAGIGAVAATLALMGRSRVGSRLDPSSPADEPAHVAVRTGSSESPGGWLTLERPVGSVFVLAGGALGPLPQALSPGQGVVTGRASSVQVVAPDGTRLALGADTVVAQLAEAPGGGLRLFLGAGQLQATVSSKRKLLLGTPHLRLTATAARLGVTAAASTRADILAGGALVTPLRGAEQPVAAGHHAVASVASGLQIVRTPAGGRALFVALGEPMWLQDNLVRARLEGHQLEVRQMLPGAPDLVETARTSSLVVISSTITARELDLTGLRELPVPILTWEPHTYDDLGMTGPCDTGACGEDASAQYGLTYPVFVSKAGHPLAGGLSGTIRVAGRGLLSWGTPNLAAAWVAIRSGEPDRAVVFGYERGAAMPGLVAPARRVGLFLQNDTPRTMTAAGWTLFDAAVVWCLDDAPRPL